MSSDRVDDNIRASDRNMDEQKKYKEFNKTLGKLLNRESNTIIKAVQDTRAGNVSLFGRIVLYLIKLFKPSLIPTEGLAGMAFESQKSLIANMLTFKNVVRLGVDYLKGGKTTRYAVKLNEIYQNHTQLTKENIFDETTQQFKEKKYNLVDFITNVISEENFTQTVLNKIDGNNPSTFIPREELNSIISNVIFNTTQYANKKNQKNSQNIAGSETQDKIEKKIQELTASALSHFSDFIRDNQSKLQENRNQLSVFTVIDLATDYIVEAVNKHKDDRENDNNDYSEQPFIKILTRFQNVITEVKAEKQRNNVKGAIEIYEILAVVLTDKEIQETLQDEKYTQKLYKILDELSPFILSEGTVIGDMYKGRAEMQDQGDISKETILKSDIKLLHSILLAAGQLEPAHIVAIGKDLEKIYKSKDSLSIAKIKEILENKNEEKNEKNIYDIILYALKNPKIFIDQLEKDELGKVDIKRYEAPVNMIISAFFPEKQEQYDKIRESFHMAHESSIIEDVFSSVQNVSDEDIRFILHIAMDAGVKASLGKYKGQKKPTAELTKEEWEQHKEHIKNIEELVENISKIHTKISKKNEEGSDFFDKLIGILKKEETQQIVKTICKNHEVENPYIEAMLLSVKNQGIIKAARKILDQYQRLNPDLPVQDRFKLLTCKILTDSTILANLEHNSQAICEIADIILQNQGQYQKGDLKYAYPVLLNFLQAANPMHFELTENKDDHRIKTFGNENDVKELGEFFKKLFLDKLLNSQEIYNALYPSKKQNALIVEEILEQDNTKLEEQSGEGVRKTEEQEKETFGLQDAIARMLTILPFDEFKNQKNNSQVLELYKEISPILKKRLSEIKVNRGEGEQNEVKQDLEDLINICLFDQQINEFVLDDPEKLDAVLDLAGIILKKIMLEDIDYNHPDFLERVKKEEILFQEFKKIIKDLRIIGKILPPGTIAILNNISDKAETKKIVEIMASPVPQKDFGSMREHISNLTARITQDPVLRQEVLQPSRIIDSFKLLAYIIIRIKKDLAFGDMLVDGIFAKDICEWIEKSSLLAHDPNNIKANVNVKPYTYLISHIIFADQNTLDNINKITGQIIKILPPKISPSKTQDEIKFDDFIKSIEEFKKVLREKAGCDNAENTEKLFNNIIEIFLNKNSEALKIDESDSEEVKQEKISRLNFIISCAKEKYTWQNIARTMQTFLKLSFVDEIIEGFVESQIIKSILTEDKIIEEYQKTEEYRAKYAKATEAIKDKKIVNDYKQTEEFKDKYEKAKDNILKNKKFTNEKRKKEYMESKEFEKNAAEITQQLLDIHIKAECKKADQKLLDEYEGEYKRSDKFRKYKESDLFQEKFTKRKKEYGEYIVKAKESLEKIENGQLMDSASSGNFKYIDNIQVETIQETMKHNLQEVFNIGQEIFSSQTQLELSTKKGIIKGLRFGIDKIMAEQTDDYKKGYGLIKNYIEKNLEKNNDTIPLLSKAVLEILESGKMNEAVNIVQPKTPEDKKKSAGIFSGVMKFGETLVIGAGLASTAGWKNSVNILIEGWNNSDIITYFMTHTNELSNWLPKMLVQMAREENNSINDNSQKAEIKLGKEEISSNNSFQNIITKIKASIDTYYEVPQRKLNKDKRQYQVICSEVITLAEVIAKHKHLIFDCDLDNLENDEKFNTDFETLYKSIKGILQTGNITKFALEFLADSYLNVKMNVKVKEPGVVPVVANSNSNDELHIPKQREVDAPPGVLQSDDPEIVRGFEGKREVG